MGLCNSVFCKICKLISYKLLEMSYILGTFEVRSEGLAFLLVFRLVGLFNWGRRSIFIILGELGATPRRREGLLLG